MRQAGTVELRANLHLELRDEQGRLWQERHVANLVVDAGLNLVRDLLMGSKTGGLTHIAVGTSSTAAAAGQTALVASTLKLPISVRTATDKKATFTTYFASTQANASLQEVGLFHNDTLVARATFATITKTSGLTLNATWELTAGTV